MSRVEAPRTPISFRYGPAPSKSDAGAGASRRRTRASSRCRGLHSGRGISYCGKALPAGIEQTCDGPCGAAKRRPRRAAEPAAATPGKQPDRRCVQTSGRTCERGSRARVSGLHPHARGSSLPRLSNLPTGVRCGRGIGAANIRSLSPAAVGRAWGHGTGVGGVGGGAWEGRASSCARPGGPPPHGLAGVRQTAPSRTGRV